MTVVSNPPTQMILYHKHTTSSHYGDVIMDRVTSEITSLTIVYSTVYSGADQRKHQSSASLAFVRGIHRGPGNSPHKWPLTRKMFPFDDVIMVCHPHKGCPIQFHLYWDHILSFVVIIMKVHLSQYFVGSRLKNILDHHCFKTSSVTSQWARLRL